MHLVDAGHVSGAKNKRPVPGVTGLIEDKTDWRLRAGSPDSLLVLLEVLDLLHRKVPGTRAGFGGVGSKCAHAPGWPVSVKRAGAVVAPEIPIRRDGVKTTRDISLGEVEAVSGHRAQDYAVGNK